MISYNQRDFETMRQEAIKRIREMHKHSQQSVSDNGESANHNAFTNSTSTENKHNSSTENMNQTSFRNNRQNMNNQNFRQNNNSQSTNKSQNANQSNQRGGNQQQFQNNRSSGGNPFAQLFGSNLGGFNKYKQNNPQANQPQKPPQAQMPPEPPKQGDDLVSDIKDKLSGMLKDFNIDDEKIILGLLIYVLYKNKADLKLLIALAYLII